MPKCNTSTDGYVLHLVEHQVSDLVKGTERISNEKMKYLPFSSRFIVRVELAQFDVTEQRFDGRGREAVGAGEDDLEPESVDDALSLGAGVVSCIIPENDGVFLPSWSF